MRTFNEGVYYEINPEHCDYKKRYALYKCIFSSEMGAVLTVFNEDGKIINEIYAPQGAKRYIVSDLNEKLVKQKHYTNLYESLENESVELEKKLLAVREHLSMVRNKLGEQNAG